MDFLLGLAGAAAIYAVILVNKWQVMRVIKREIDSAKVKCAAEVIFNRDLLQTRIGRVEDKVFDAVGRIGEKIPAFGVCEICGKPGFADGMTKMTGREYDDLRGVVGLNRCLIHNHVVHIHDECLRRAGYVHEYGVVAGWRKVAAKKGKG